LTSAIEKETHKCQKLFTNRSSAAIKAKITSVSIVIMIQKE